MQPAVAAQAPRNGLLPEGALCLPGGRASGHVVVLVRAVLVPLHVVPVYERLNPLLQISRLEKNSRGPSEGVWLTLREWVRAHV